ncbi:MAG: Ig-like domain-containing protein [Dehalococcoidales bacterium]|nr:Ig-like domain-containing protein [Dehalococcoidales bacterium]
MVVLSVGCGIINKPPVIQSITAERNWVDTSHSVTIECLASDPDGDGLSYHWLANAGTVSGAGSIVTWTAPDNPGDYTVALAVSDGRGGKATASLTLDVRLNNLPVIEDLIAELLSLRAGDSATVECLASDPDGDELSYQWSANAGTISGTGSIVTWTAPGALAPLGGTVSVTVSDGRGGEVISEIYIMIQPNELPVIEDLIAAVHSVRSGEEIAIECIASDPDGDELSYQWIPNGGTISGDGSSVIWTAPDSPGNYSVTVDVSDGRDAVSASEPLELEVLPNQPPVINKLKAEKTILLIGKSTVIRCEASDPEGDEITYEWSADGGEFSGDGEEVNWTAAGGCGDQVTIIVTVEDGYGGEASAEIKIWVRTPG